MLQFPSELGSCLCPTAWKKQEEEEEKEGAQHRAASEGTSPVQCVPGMEHPRGSHVEK